MFIVFLKLPAFILSPFPLWLQFLLISQEISQKTNQKYFLFKVLTHILICTIQVLWVPIASDLVFNVNLKNALTALSVFSKVMGAPVIPAPWFRAAPCLQAAGVMMLRSRWLLLVIVISAGIMHCDMTRLRQCENQAVKWDKWPCLCYLWELILSPRRAAFGFPQRHQSSALASGEAG